MQVDEDLESGGVGPVERTVEEPDAAGMPRHVAEDEIRHRDTHQVAAVRSDGTEIVERDVGLAMAAQETVEGVRRHGPVHPDLVGFAAGAEQPGRHPAFQHEPVAQIHPADRFVEAQRHPITSIPCDAHLPSSHTGAASERPRSHQPPYPVHIRTLTHSALSLSRTTAEFRGFREWFTVTMCQSPGTPPVTVIYRNRNPSFKTAEFQGFREWITVTIDQSPQCTTRGYGL